MNFKSIKSLGMTFALTLAAATTLSAQDTGSYKPGIWVDPDGCQHWVMDLGVEGMMSPVLTKDGRPVCTFTQTCADLRADALFAIDSDVVRPSARNTILKMADQIVASGSKSIEIVGHTDSTAPDDYNIALSERRAKAVAAIAGSKGLAISKITGLGESKPIASNATKAGRQANRRVEIYCR